MDFFKASYKDCMIEISISIWIILFIIVLIAAYYLFIHKKSRYGLVKLNIKLGNVGNAEFKPNNTDLQIAHKIWTELVTRKAAIPIDKENDVIEEIYNSWYALFQKVREFISEVPADLIRKNKSTREIVRIATKTLNDGLRPHLTMWQAKFRTWHENNKDRLKEMTPQELQKEYKEYSILVDDLLRVNALLIEYSTELKKIIDK